MSNLGRSLSLNTGSSLFGNTGATSQPQQPGGLFGSSTSQPAQPGGLFGSTPASQPAQQGGLFGGGGAAAAPAQSATTGGLFKLGAPPAASQPAASTGGGLFGTTATTQPAAGGLFGSAAPAASKPGGLFGSTMASAAPAAGGLFGGAPAAAAPSSAPSGGLFGSTAATTQPAAGGLFGGAPASKPGGLFSTAATTQPAAGGLFGASTATPQPAAGGLFGASTAAAQPAAGGLFGASTAASQPAAGGLFGAKPAAPVGGLFGASNPAQQQQPAPSNSLFGALNNANPSAQAAQQAVPAVKLDWTNVKPTTRFNELHQEVQDAIVFIDEIIQGAMRASMQCSEALPSLGRQIDSLPADVEYLERRLETVEGALGRDAVAVGASKEVVEKDSEDAVRLFRAVENLKLPNQFHYSTIGFSDPSANTSTSADAATTTDLLSYFSKRADELDQQVKVFERHQREVDAHLRTVEMSAVENMRKLGRTKGQQGGDGIGEGLREIAGVMRTFEEAILRVAERVGEGRERVVDLELGGGGGR